MWNLIKDQKDIDRFMKVVSFLHDACIKQIKYVSGAYVKSDLSMHPINDKRVLNILIQMQNEKAREVELCFQGLKFLKLSPRDESYTCEITGSAMFFSNGYIYWCDSAAANEKDTIDTADTVVCASACSWRLIECSTGPFCK